MDSKNEFENVMKGNSYLKLKIIVNDRESWNPEAVLAAEKELSFRDQTFRITSERSLSDFSDKEINLLLSDSERYPDKYIEQITNERSKRDAIIASAKTHTQSEKEKLNSDNGRYKRDVMIPAETHTQSEKVKLNSDNEISKKDAIIADETHMQSKKIKLDSNNEKLKQETHITEKEEAEIQNYSTTNQMNNKYKVVPFNPSNNISNSLQKIIDSEAVNGWRYVNHQYSDKLKPGSAGCFGIGATSDVTIHVGFVIFERS